MSATAAAAVLVAPGDEAGFIAAVGTLAGDPERAEVDARRSASPRRAACAWDEVLERFEAQLQDTVDAPPSAACAQFPSWPEPATALARARALGRALDARRRDARPWVVRSLDAVSRLGDGWIWYAIIAALPWLAARERHDLRRCA